MKKLKEEDINERLIFLLDKEELSIEEMRWLLNYLEEEDDQQFRKILYRQFQQESSSPEHLSDINGTDLLNIIREKLYKRLFE